MQSSASWLYSPTPKIVLKHTNVAKSSYSMMSYCDMTFVLKLVSCDIISYYIHIFVIVQWRTTKFLVDHITNSSILVVTALRWPSKTTLSYFQSSWTFDILQLWPRKTETLEVTIEENGGFWAAKKISHQSIQ